MVHTISNEDLKEVMFILNDLYKNSMDHEFHNPNHDLCVLDDCTLCRLENLLRSNHLLMEILKISLKEYLELQLSHDEIEEHEFVAAKVVNLSDYRK